MNVKELSKEQLTELKCNYYCNVVNDSKGVSYEELANIDNLVSDEQVFEEYADTEFVNDDFFCSMDEED